MNSSLQSNKMEESISKTNSRQNKDRDEVKHVQQNLELMRNRVQLLRSQLQHEKDAITRHKSLTEQVVKKKIEFHKINSLKTRDNSGVEQEIRQMRQRNQSYREMHKNQMNNILKAVYLVKLDDARQIKNASLQNRKSLQKLNQSYKEQQKRRKREIQSQREGAKQKYLEYWKNKLNSIYEQQKKTMEGVTADTQEKKKSLRDLQEEELKLLEQINRVREKQMDSKKQYLAALSLSSKEVAEAARENKADRLNRDRSSIQMNSNRSEAQQRYKQTQFFTKSPIVSLMSSNNIKIPRANVDQNKFQIILKELKRLQKMQQSGNIS